MIWDISPIAFSLGWNGHYWPVHWYGLFFASTFLYGTLACRYLYRQAGQPEDDVYDLVVTVIAGTVLGARLGHVLLYDPVYYLTHPWKILMVWEGGLASHGAVIGILVSVWLYARVRPQQSFLWVCDRIGLLVPLSGFLIRLGNFFNSEILGTPTDLPWGVVFARIDPIPRHPVQLYEAGCYLLAFIVQVSYYRTHRDALPLGNLFGRFFVLIFGARFFMEFFKEGQAAFESGWTVTVGQWLSVPAVLVGLYLIRRSRRGFSEGHGG